MPCCCSRGMWGIGCHAQWEAGGPSVPHLQGRGAALGGGRQGRRQLDGREGDSKRREGGGRLCIVVGREDRLRAVSKSATLQEALEEQLNRLELAVGSLSSTLQPVGALPTNQYWNALTRRSCWSAVVQADLKAAACARSKLVSVSSRSGGGRVGGREDVRKYQNCTPVCSSSMASRPTTRCSCRDCWNC